MKRYFGLILSTILLFGTSVFATYEDFSKQLNTMGIETENIQSQNKISRYELTRLLNIVECKDCVNPTQEMISKYTQNFWSVFSSGKDFKDIGYLGGIYKDTSYYYCVAYVGENVYMRGYPQATSPLCGGKFCGEKNTTVAEFIQVIINILSKHLQKSITINWKEVNARRKKLSPESYEYKNISGEEQEIIGKNSTNCETTCALQNAEEMNIYLTYCMFNLSKCGMQEIGKIKQGYWPVAELNLLYRQNIIDIDQNQRRNIDSAIDGKTVLETLFKLNSKIDCSFNNDYDCDTLDNANDNCPNTYNPKQKDTDKDGIGDVCDDDIDGDTIKNPISIVDDEDRINIALWTGNIDNCLYITNTNQTDTNSNTIGDVCEDQKNQIGIYISLNDIQGQAPLTTTMTAITAGEIQDIHWDFGDGTQGEGNTVVHTFNTPGRYYIQATAIGTSTEATAQTTLVVGGETSPRQGLQARTSILGKETAIETRISLATIGDYDRIERKFPKDNTTQTTTAQQEITKTFSDIGEHPVIIKGYKNNEIKAVNAFTIGIGTGKGSLLRSNTLLPEIGEKILLDTTTYNSNQNTIANVYRDLGDGTKKNTTSMTIQHNYTKAGTKIITQTITYTDASKQTNMLTLHVQDKHALQSYALIISPSKLIANLGEKIVISTRIVGNLFKTPITQIFQGEKYSSQQKSGTEKMPTIFSHTYKKSGAQSPQANLFVDQCISLKTQATIAIKGSDLCMDILRQGAINTYKCDMDKDGIPDICDADIDGDGFQNLLGIINSENTDCSYNTNISQTILKKHYQYICSLDNAPFDNNNDQLDLNLDGIGDAQTQSTYTTIQTIKDGDGDGIPDTTDICPTIQETRNGIQDTDGCPEVGQEIDCNPILATVDITNDNFIIKPVECNQCPCQFSDFANDMTNNDSVRAVLRDKEKTIQYKFSSPWIVDY